MKKIPSVHSIVMEIQQFVPMCLANGPNIFALGLFAWMPPTLQAMEFSLVPIKTETKLEYFDNLRIYFMLNLKVVIVAVNMGDTTSQQFSINGGPIPSSFTPHISSESKKITNEANVNVANGSFTYTLQARSVTTFVSN